MVLHNGGSHVNGFEKSAAQAKKVVAASLRPLPTETGDGTYVENKHATGLAKDITHIDISDVRTAVDVVKGAATGDPINDRTYLLERVIQVGSMSFASVIIVTCQLTADLPSTSRNGHEITNALIDLLWSDLKHPPISYLGRDFKYRKADGSGNVRDLISLRKDSDLAEHPLAPYRGCWHSICKIGTTEDNAAGSSSRSRGSL